MVAYRILVKLNNRRFKIFVGTQKHLRKLKEELIYQKWLLNYIIMENKDFAAHLS